MGNANFTKSADDFRMWLNTLVASLDLVDQAQQTLDGQLGSLPDTSPNQMAELILRRLNKRINDVMGSFDTMLASINMPPVYQTYFDSTELTEEGWKQLLALLKSHKRDDAKDVGD